MNRRLIWMNWGLDRAAAVLAEMDADEAVDILENLNPEKKALIARMDQESKDDIHLIFSYDEEQIGSRMTTNYIVIPNNCTIKRAMRHLISQAEDNDNIDTIYVEDENGRYFGAIELKDLITAREYMKLEGHYQYLLSVCTRMKIFGLYGRADRLQRGFYPQYSIGTIKSSAPSLTRTSPRRSTTRWVMTTQSWQVLLPKRICTNHCCRV